MDGQQFRIAVLCGDFARLLDRFLRLGCEFVPTDCHVLLSLLHTPQDETFDAKVLYAGLAFSETPKRSEGSSENIISLFFNMLCIHID